MAKLNLNKIFTGTTANDETGTPARSAAQGINENMDLIGNELVRIDDAAEKKVNKATDLTAPDHIKYPSVKAVSDAIGSIESNANTYTDNQLTAYQKTEDKGAADGYAGLDSNSKVPVANTYAAVEEIVEGTYIDATTFNDDTGTAVTPGTAKIYQDTSTGNATSGQQFRWGGSQYAQIVGSPGTTDEVSEGTSNLYFTRARVRAVLLTGLSTVTATAIVAGDSVLAAFGKLQGQINSLTNSLGNKLEKGGYTGTAQALYDFADTKETPTGAKTKADTAEQNAKDYYDANAANIRLSNVAGDLSETEKADVRGKIGVQSTDDVLKPVTDEFFFSAGDTQTKTLSYTPVDGKVRIFINGNRIYTTQYNLLNEKQVEILDTLTDGDPIAIDYQRLASELITLLLLTPQGGIEKWNVDRNSTATYEDENGVIQTAPVNTARIDYRTGSAKILVEGQSTNLLLRSEEIDFPEWSKASVTVTANNESSPENKLNADTVSSGNNTTQGVYQSVAVTENLAYTMSLYVRLGTMAATDFKFAVYDSSNGNFIFADESPNTTVSDTEWSKVKKTFTTPSGCSSVRIYLFRNSAAVSGTLILWGAQLEQGSKSTSYIPTNGTTVTRLADTITVAPPSGTSEITEVIDGVTTKVTTIPATYQVPNGNVSKIEMK